MGSDEDVDDEEIESGLGMGEESEEGSEEEASDDEDDSLEDEDEDEGNAVTYTAFQRSMLFAGPLKKTPAKGILKTPATEKQSTAKKAVTLASTKSPATVSEVYYCNSCLISVI